MSLDRGGWPALSNRAAFLAFVMILLFVGMVSNASSKYRGENVYVPQYGDASDVLYKPRKWKPTGNGSLSFSGIRWESYGGRTARGTATARSSDCNPDCDSGRVTKRRVKFTLSRPRTFECAPTTYVYSRLKFSPSLPNHPSKMKFTYCSNRFG